MQALKTVAYLYIPL